MVPRVSIGSDFQGAKNYFTHDVGGSTSERVDWVYIHNIPTQDVDAAFKYMEHTRASAEVLKRHAGVSSAGRKVSRGSVYTFSLSWHPSESPSDEHMRETTLEALHALGLESHEAVIVSHNDRPHRHTHCITNLINPENGKMADTSYDFLTLSQFAELYEKRQGRIVCPERVINNERRREEASQGRELALVKHREKRVDRSELISELYHLSDTGSAFQAALKQQGYILSRGDRRGFVLVEEHSGDVFSLSRQINGQRAKDIRQRLAGLDPAGLPVAKELSLEIRASERVSTRKALERVEERDSGPEKEAEQAAVPRLKQGAFAEGKKRQTPDHRWALVESDRFLMELDAAQQVERKEDMQRNRLEIQQRDYYQRSRLEDQLNELDAQIEKSGSIVGRVSGRRKKLLEQRELTTRNLENIRQRIAEQQAALEKSLSLNRSQNKQAQVERQRLERLAALRDKWQQEDESKLGQSQSFESDWGLLH